MNWYQSGFFPPDQTTPVHAGIFTPVAMAQGIATQIAIKNRWSVLGGFLHPLYDKLQQNSIEEHDIFQLWAGGRKSWIIPRKIVVAAEVLTGFGIFCLPCEKHNSFRDIYVALRATIAKWWAYGFVGGFTGVHFTRYQEFRIYYQNILSPNAGIQLGLGKNRVYGVVGMTLNSAGLFDVMPVVYQIGLYARFGRDE